MATTTFVPVTATSRSRRAALRGLLDEGLLSGQHEVTTVLRPKRVARPVAADDLPAVLIEIEQACQVWGGAGQPLLPVRDGGLPEPYTALLRTEQVDFVSGLQNIEVTLPFRVKARRPWWHPAILVAAHEPLNRWRTVRIVELDVDDPWRPIYDAVLGKWPETPDPDLSQLAGLREDLRFEEVAPVERVATVGSLDDLVERLVDREFLTPRTVSNMFMSHGLRPDTSFIRAGDEILPNPRTPRRAAGPNLIVAMTAGSVEDVALLWNLRGAHGQGCAMPIGIPADEINADVLRGLQDETRNKLVSTGVIDQIAHICKVAVGLHDIDANVFREINLGHTLAIIFRSSRQMRLKQKYLNSAMDDVGDLSMKALGSVFADDEPDWVTFDDVRELAREMIPAAYSVGGSTSETYLEQTARVLDITNLEDMQQYENLQTSDLIDFSTALLAYGLCSGVVNILQSQENRVGKFFRETVLSGNDKALGTEFLEETVQYGDYKVLEGEAWLAKAEWQEAQDALSMACLLYDYGGDDMLAMRGSARALKLLGDLAWMSGNVEKIPRLEMRVHALVILRQQDWQKDVLTTSYLDHFLARQCMAEYLQMYYLWLQYKDDPERAGRAELESHDNPKKADTAASLLKQVKQEYLTGEHVRENFALAYERILSTSRWIRISR